MTKGPFLISCILILSLFFISAASAQIILPKFNEIYSLGDTIDSSFSVIETQYVNGLTELELVCDDYNTLFYTAPVSLKANEEKEISIEDYALTKTGECAIEARLEGQNGFSDSIKSAKFTISDELKITFNSYRSNLDPGQTLRIDGMIVKANGEPLDGTGIITLNNEGYSKTIKKGVFKFETTLIKTFPSGEQELLFEASDDNGNIGRALTNITVTAIPTSLEIISNKEAFVPGDSLESYGILYDQGYKAMNKPVSIILYDSWGLDVLKKMTNEPDPLVYEFGQKSATGEWWLYAYSEGIKERKFIKVEEVSAIDAELKDNILKIFNTGNTIFKKPVEIMFQQDSLNTEIKNLELEIAGNKEYELNAPEGEYNLTIKSEGFEKTFSGVYLTGNIIKIEDLDNNSLNKLQKVLAIVIIMGILATAIILKIKNTNPGKNKIVRLKIRN